MYKQHSLRFEFTNQTASFDKSGNNKISISNVKAMFKFGAYGNQAGVQAEATIYGLGLDLLSALSSKGINTWMQMQRIHTSVYADDTKVFSGFIVYSCANMNAAPETALTLNMVSGFDLQAASAQPFSRPGTVKLADVLAAICEPYQYRLNPVGIDGLVASNNLSIWQSVRADPIRLQPGWREYADRRKPGNCMAYEYGQRRHRSSCFS